MPTSHIAPDVEAPSTGEWVVDPGHADVAFIGRHFGLTKIRGRFTDVAGTATIADPLDGSHVEVTINMASVSSGDKRRDDHLRSSDFFDVEHYPTATFRSTDLSVVGNRGTMTGELTIKGVARPVALDVEFLGQTRDPWGHDRASFSATTRIDREHWGLTWNMLLETGGLLVSKEIAIELELELMRPAP